MSTNIFITGLQQLQKRLQEAADANRRAALEREARDVRLQVFASTPTPTSPVNAPVRPIRSLLKGAGPTAQRDQNKRRIAAAEANGMLGWYVFEDDNNSYGPNRVHVISGNGGSKVTKELEPFRAYEDGSRFGPYGEHWPFSVDKPWGPWTPLDYNPSGPPDQIVTWFRRAMTDPTTGEQPVVRIPTHYATAVDASVIGLLPVRKQEQFLYLRQNQHAHYNYYLEVSVPGAETNSVTMQYQDRYNRPNEESLADPTIYKTISIVVSEFAIDSRVLTSTAYFPAEGNTAWHIGKTTVGDCTSAVGSFFSMLEGRGTPVSIVPQALATGLAALNTPQGYVALYFDVPYQGNIVQRIQINVVHRNTTPYLPRHTVTASGSDADLYLLSSTPVACLGSLFHSVPDEYTYIDGYSVHLSSLGNRYGLRANSVAVDILSDTLNLTSSAIDNMPLGELFGVVGVQADFCFETEYYNNEALYFAFTRFYYSSATTLTLDRHAYDVANIDFTQPYWGSWTYPPSVPARPSTQTYELVPLASRQETDIQYINFLHTNVYGDEAACLEKLANIGVTLPPRA